MRKYFLSFAHYKEKLDDGEKGRKFSASLIIFALTRSSSINFLFSPFFYFHKSLFASCLFSSTSLRESNFVLSIVFKHIFVPSNEKKFSALFSSSFRFIFISRRCSRKMFSSRTSSIESSDIHHEFPFAADAERTHLEMTCKLSSPLLVQLTALGCDCKRER